ncbi:MAG: hypothetical protein CMM74_12985 [Rhodospirillaceae bacterium]|nr:hypothetical protein [Rhodospirillaceae bacterium]
MFVTVYLISLFSIGDRIGPRNRYQYLAYAIVQNHTLDITEIEEQHGYMLDANDYQGKRLIWSSPGIGLLVAPVYGLSNLLHIEERIGVSLGAESIQAYRDLIFAMTVNAPSAALFVTSLWLMLRWQGLTRRLSCFLVLCSFWGSMTAYYFTVGNNVQSAVHMALTTAGWASLLTVARARAARKTMLISGLFLGLAVLVYESAYLTTLCALVYAALKHGKRAWALVGGIVPGAAGLLVYQWIALGNPFLNVNVVFSATPPLGYPQVTLISVAYQYIAGRSMGIIWYFPLATILLCCLRVRRFSMSLSGFCWILIAGHWLLAIWGTWHFTNKLGGPIGWEWQAGVGPAGPRVLLPTVPFIALLVAQLDFRSVYLRTWMNWMGVLGLSLNIPILMYPAGGPVFRGLFLMLKHGMIIPLPRIVPQLLPLESVIRPLGANDFMTWAVVLALLVLWLWTSSRFRDWLFEGTAKPS